MCPYDARNALSVANLTPIDYRGGPLLQAVQNIEDGARNRRVLRLMFNVCDKSVVHWFERAICVTHTQNALFDEELVNIARWIVNNERLAEKAEHDELIEATIFCARKAVAMADLYGDASCWWMDAVFKC
jgi:hypothetical protein